MIKTQKFFSCPKDLFYLIFTINFILFHQFRLFLTRWDETKDDKLGWFT